MRALLTPELDRSARLVKVVKAFGLSHDLTPSERRAIVGQTQAVRTLIEAGTAANGMAKVELAVLRESVQGMTEVGDWPAFITKYIDELERAIR